MVRYWLIPIALTVLSVSASTFAGAQSAPRAKPGVDQIHPECVNNKRQRRCTCAKEVGAPFGRNGSFDVSRIQIAAPFEACMKNRGWPLDS